MDENPTYKQKELSDLFGWSRPWVRRIELLGLLPDLDSEPQRGRKGRVYSSADVYQIFWVAALRHAGIEFAEIKEYVEKASELLSLLKKYKAESGVPLQPVFFHKPQHAAGLFFIQPDKILTNDLVKIGQLAQLLENKTDELRLRVQKWIFRMDPVFRQIHDIGKQATKSMESMYHINHICLENRLLSLK